MDTQSLRKFIDLAYQCLNPRLMRRPAMDQILKELEDVLELQYKHANPEHPQASYEGISSNNMKMEFLKIPLSKILQATDNFHEKYMIGSGGFGKVYKAELDVIDIQALSSMEGMYGDELPKIRKVIAIKRILSKADQGEQGYLTEVELLSSCMHTNIISFFGFCREAHEMILVYELALKGSLSDYLENSGKKANLSWTQRIQICLNIAHGINYLHTNMDGKPMILHRDIKSDNVLLDENLNAKISDFGLSMFPRINHQASIIINTKHFVGTNVYMDPEYLATGKYKRESDIYSFGVVLFEVLSGSLAYDPIYSGGNDTGLAHIARRRFNEGTLKELIDQEITEEDDYFFTLNGGPNQASFDTFSKVAYQCLAETQAKRPTMKYVIEELQNALKLQGETVVLSRFRFNDIVLATENFAETYCIGFDTNGTVYKADLDQFGNNSLLATEEKFNSEPSKKHTTVAIKRITNRKGGQGKQEFFEEIEMRTSYKHPNIVSLLGFCDEDDEMILVYEHVSERSLDDYLKSVDNMDNFTWTHRLRMCLEIARGLSHLHPKMANPQRVMQSDIKSANMLLDKNGGAKISYSGISKLRQTNHEVDMKVYEDPEYKLTHNLETKSDVYSFGVVLFEIFCGRVAYDEIYIKEYDQGLAPIACQCFKDGTIERIMDQRLKEEMGEDIFTSNRGPNKDSLDTFLKIAYACLDEEAARRPTAEMVIKELERALHVYETQAAGGK